MLRMEYLMQAFPVAFVLGAIGIGVQVSTNRTAAEIYWPLVWVYFICSILALLSMYVDIVVLGAGRYDR